MTAERSRLVQFIFPSYYSSGAAVFAPGGAIEGVSSWHDLSGKTLSAVEGNYVVDAAPETPALQNVMFVLAATIEGGEIGLHPAGMLTVQFWQALNCCTLVPPAPQKRLLSSLPARLMDTSSERYLLFTTVLSMFILQLPVVPAACPTCMRLAADASGTCPLHDCICPIFISPAATHRASSQHLT